MTPPSSRPLFDQTDEPAFIADPAADRFVAVNEALCALLGYTHEQLLLTPVTRIHRGELPQLLDFIGDALRRGHGSTVALTCRMQCGRCLPTEMSLHAYDDVGRVLVLGLVRDRSEHRHSD